MLWDTKLHPLIFEITLSNRIVFWSFLAHKYWSKFTTKLQHNCPPLLMARLFWCMSQSQKQTLNICYVYFSVTVVLKRTLLLLWTKWLIFVLQGRVRTSIKKGGQFCCKFTSVSVCQKLSKYGGVWQSYCKHKMVHFSKQYRFINVSLTHSQLRLTSWGS